MRRVMTLAATLLALAACGGSSARPAGSDTASIASSAAERVRLVQVASGLDSPTHLAAPKSEPGRLYVVEQAGRIVVVEDGKVRAQPFLDIVGLVRSGGEQGLFSVAFHPNYTKNHRFYVDYTDKNGDTRVVEYRSDGTTAIPGSARQLLFVKQPYANHNGGQLAFGPDGLLYVGMGDGGSGGDPMNNAQNMGSALGKLLRIDVDRAGAKWRIAALGLRNPWRFSFDRDNGNLYIGDVGQGAWEEIDFRARSASGLANYGWSVWEGRHTYEPDRRLTRGKLVQPIAEYSHDGGCSVTGGFAYRGSSMPAVRGRYFYGDYCSGIVWSLRVRGGKALSLRREPFRVDSLISWGEDARGELYAVSGDGVIYRLAR